MKFQGKLNYRRWVEIILIIVISALAYLPNLTKATIYRDDWYYAMDRTISGPGVFQEMFSIDRPARGPLFEVYYQLFDVQPLPYHLSSYLWRLLGGLSALYLFNLLWPNQKRATLFMALLFTLFPGYSRWLEGFENQPRILSSFLEVLSIALTLQAIRSTRRASKIVAWIGSILAGWAYIALLDFAIGMEFFRLACVFVLVCRDQQGISLVKKFLLTLRTWAIAALIPAGFLFWRLFIFHNERPTTDIGLQLSYLVKSPAQTGLWWLIRLFQSTVNITVLPWGAPLFQSLFGLHLSSILIGIFIAVIAASCLLLAYYLTDKINNDGEVSNPSQGIWQIEAILIGLAGVVIGVLPVIMANRYATLGNYSHYALPASLASVVLAGGVVYSLSSSRVRLGVMSALVLFSVLTHYIISMQITREEKIVSNFWQQVVWRAPGIQAGTTLMVNYPSVDYGQDVDTVAGPANFLYFPEQTNQIPATYQLSALEQGDYTSKDILADPKKSSPFRYRTHGFVTNYANLLVITQPSEEACVHVIDSRWPRQNPGDGYSILLVGPLSKVERIDPNAIPPKPAESIFGPEPAHRWCFYYQKAELALQTDNWQQIITLGNEVWKQDLHPQDPIEWMPFLQAYAYSGDISSIGNVAKQTKREAFFRKQACQTLHNMNTGVYPLQPQVLDEINRLFCEN
jgi:hypothetical protein